MAFFKYLKEDSVARIKIEKVAIALSVQCTLKIFKAVVKTGQAMA